MGKDKKLMINGKRLDGREPEDLRPVLMKVGILNNADGSSYIQWGGNKVLCGVFGPRECIPKHAADPFKALIKCTYTMSPFASKEEHGRGGPTRRSTEISKVIKEVFENLIFAEKYPRTQIDIFIDVLQAEGGTRVASVTAAALALADAGIPMRDMVSAVAIGKIEGELIVDLGKEEDNSGQSDMPLAISSKDKSILLLQMDGLLTKEDVEKALDMAERGSEKLSAMQRAALEKRYEEDVEPFKL